VERYSNIRNFEDQVKFHFITVLWGNYHTELFLKVAIPNQLSPNNLPSLLFRNNSIYKIYTTSKDAEKIENSSVFRKLSEIIFTKIILIDGFGEVIHKGIVSGDKHKVLAQCYRESLQIAAMENGVCVFLVPDGVFPDGTFPKLERIIENGKKATLIPPFRVVKETFVPVFLERFYSEKDLTATISSRELAKLTLDHLHPEYKVSFWDSSPFNHWPSQLLWRVKDEGVLLRSFTPFFLASKPPYRKIIPESLWDRMAPMDGCDYPLFAHPNFDDVYVAVDSDDMFLTGIDSVRYSCGPWPCKRSRIFKVAVWATCAGFANSHHLRCVTYKMRIHSCGITPSLWKKVEKTSDRVINQILLLSKHKKILKIANWIGVLVFEDKKLNSLLHSALYYLQRGRLKKAEKRLKKILSMKPPDKQIIILTHYNLGSLYEKKSNLERATEKFNKVINLAKGIPSFEGGAHFHLGCIYKRMGEIDKARHHFEECLKFIPKHKKARKNLRSLKEGVQESV
jgi:hypothetical protein